MRALNLTRRFQDALQHSIDIRQNLIIPKSKDQKTGIIQNSGPTRFTLDVLGVLTAVNLNNQLRFLTEKIRDKSSDRDLSAKLQAAKTPATNMEPKFQFGIRLVAPKLSRSQHSAHQPTSTP